jgi:3-keto-5-aminohexanoate cleavage enzyme
LVPAFDALDDPVRRLSHRPRRGLTARWHHDRVSQSRPPPSTPTRPSAHTLITVAPTGAESTKVDVPQLPTTLEDLVDTARRCEAAGAALIHLHIRDAEHRPTLDAGRLRASVEAVREQTDLVVQLSTGGSVHDPLDQRLTVLDAAPDSCSFTCGTTNFGDDVFLNPWPFMVQLFRQSVEREVVPEFELFDLGHVAALRRLLDQEGLPFGGKVHADFVTGVPGGMPGTVAALVAGVALLPPSVTSWSATGIGRAHLPIAAAALAAGGHLRVGMEDNLVYARGRAVEHNDELVSRAAELCTLMQRPPMTTAAARELLGVKRR